MGRRGEALVVAMVLARVLYGAPPELFLWEMLGLVLVGLSGFLMELSIEGNSDSQKIMETLKPRLGASSGIFLGTVTLPTVMMSRLIQLSRGTSHVHPSYILHLENLRMQFWIVCACSLGVIFFLLLSFSPANASGRKTKPLMITSFIATIFSIECLLSVSNNRRSDNILRIVVTMSLLLLLHGLASRTIVKYILQKFPFCLSIGETVLVAGGLVLYFSDVVMYALAKVHVFDLSSGYFEEFIANEDESAAIIQASLGSLLLASKLYKIFLYIWSSMNGINLKDSENGMATAGIPRAIAFYAAIGVAVTLIAPAWLFFIKDFRTHPLLWVFNFMFTNAVKRLSLCIYWVAVICLAVTRFYNVSKGSKIERILLRKYYHLLAVIMFVPAVLLDAEFLKLAFGMALAVFIALEMIRIWKIIPLGNVVDHFMNAFTDHRDSKLLIISHFSLLLGCALPIWISGQLIDRPLAQFAGILSLGIGDSMASLVGHKYGVLRWSKGEKKTIEGTAAGITSVLLACSFLLPSLAWTGLVSSQGWLSLLIAVVLAGLLEAHTTQLDNAFIPLIFYSLLCC